MVVDHQKAQRLGIYFFYDAQGIVDEYVFYFLKKIQPFLSNLYIVCNGAVEEKSLARLRQDISGNVILRENSGLDAEAYKAVQEQVGFDRLVSYDELILMNYTVFGPLTSFEEMFSVMSSKDLDFWGITSHGEVDGNPFPQNGFANMPEHIQSHFLVIRKSILISPVYQRYWEKLPKIRSYEDSVSYFECTFTRYFSSLGFCWATYTGTERMRDISPNPIITIPFELVSAHNCPIIKRRSFFQNYGELLHNTNGDPARKILDYIKCSTAYPVGLIWDNLLRTCHHTTLRECLQLSYILPDRYPIPGKDRKLRIALWMHIYYLDLAEKCRAYASAMPKNTDILITTNTEEKADRLKHLFGALPGHRVKVILTENRGRDNSALLVACAPYWQDYDLVCFAHDKKIGHLKYGIQGQTFSERCFQNTLASEAFVNNVIQLFLMESRMGMLCPPPPNTSVYYNTLGISDWGPNYANTKTLYDRLELTVPIDQEHPPMAPFGFVFWFRPEALHRLFEYGWRYEDFPEEPVNHDGTFLHAVERIIPYAAQQEGYYSGWLLSDSFARMELTNYHYMLRELNCSLIPICGSADFQELKKRTEALVSPGWRLLYQPLKKWLKAHLSDRAYIRIQRLKQKILG